MQIEVKEGDIYQLGRHRLMCGDATNKAHVATLFGGREPTLVITSPPYAKQRNYDRPIACWDSMMMGALDGHNLSEHAQLLINLGMVHTKGEWWPYWNQWLSEMRECGWKVFAQYIWDKKSSMAGSFNGRLGLCHEYIFHVNKKPCNVNKTEVCKFAGCRPGRYGVKGRDNMPRSYNASRIVGAFKIADGVLRIAPARNNKTAHPAVFPLDLPKNLIACWKQIDSLVYDPFCGAGTTLLACEQENVDGVGMEISEKYCEISIKRWEQIYPNHKRKLIHRSKID